MRVIIYTGKGGVGKTSIAAASALRIAASGKRVLVMSTDQAHSLGDSFGQKLSGEPQEIGENLFAMELDTISESEKNWGNLKGYMRALLTSQGQGGIEVEELLVFPGLEELFSMFRIQEMAQSGLYDVVIVDCAPTGETLSLLKYPEQLSGFLRKVLPMKRLGVKVAGPVVERMTKIPMPEDNVFDDLERLVGKMENLQNMMLDHEVVSIRIVTTPEKIVVREARRSFTCLHLYDYNVDAVIVNRIYPKRAMKGYFSKWMEMQKEGIKEIEESFSEVPKFYLKLQPREVRGQGSLKEIGEELFDSRDISEVLFCREIYSVSPKGEEVVLKILLPFAQKEELDLSCNNEELILRVKNETRRFPLPLEAQKKEIAGAKFADGYLDIVFK